MKKIKIVIERGTNDFAAYAENVAGIYGAGDTVEEAKKSVVQAIQLLKRYNSKNNIPKVLMGDYELVYKFDAESFFNYYKGLLTNTGLEKLTGISHKQLNNYATGLRKPRPAQLKKIESALHKLGNELIAVEL